jgi:hypothetical protein
MARNDGMERIVAKKKKSNKPKKAKGRTER